MKDTADGKLRLDEQSQVEGNLVTQFGQFCSDRLEYDKGTLPGKRVLNGVNRVVDSDLIRYAFRQTPLYENANILLELRGVPELDTHEKLNQLSPLLEGKLAQ